VTLRRVSPVAAVFCESPTPHFSEFAQNVSNLRSGVIESLRAVHDEIGAAALFGMPPCAPGRCDVSVSWQEFPLPCPESPGSPQKIPGSPQKIPGFGFRGFLLTH
jgi:hypothetical protein